MTLHDDLQRLVERHGAELRQDERMSRHTTFGIGGPADYYLIVSTEAALREAAAVARETGVPWFLLGSGSNIIVGDAGIRGLVIENNDTTVRMPESQSDGVRLTAASGASFARLARSTAREGLRGLEWAAGIPGTLGGAVVYNAGAYGGCLADVLTTIRALEPDGAERVIPAADLGLAYRASAFTRGLLRDRIVMEITLALQPGDADIALARIAELETKRKASAPRGRNAGSVFKNPTEHPAWWLIDHVGLRGHRIGDAQISETHTNYFLNVGAASAVDVVALMDEARARVRDAFNIELQSEVALVGGGFA